MKTSDFDYDLPETLIALRPPTKRGTSRLLVLDKATGEIEDRHYGDVTDYVQPGDVVVLNDTKVIPARLKTHKVGSDSERELVLLEKHGHADNWHQHKVLYRRRLAVDDALETADGSRVTVKEILGDGIALVNSERDLLEVAAAAGEVPLPPYMHRDATPADIERYQTVWAREAGSVAAPTASLNMTKSILDKLDAKGAIVCYLTLHVGLGTFLPIRVDDVTKHKMHEEYFEIPDSTLGTIRAAKQAGRQVWAVGTTVTRTLEHAADGILRSDQQSLSGEADIFMYPGYQFKVVDSLLTNFHAPRSTVLMLAAAFAGWDHLLEAYRHAMAEKYRFLSYGDSMLITERGRT